MTLKGKTAEKTTNKAETIKAEQKRAILSPSCELENGLDMVSQQDVGIVWERLFKFA